MLTATYLSTQNLPFPLDSMLPDNQVNDIEHILGFTLSRFSYLQLSKMCPLHQPENFFNKKRI